MSRSPRRKSKIVCPHCGQPLNVGQLLGSVTSPKKAEASRLNGRLGGKPKSANPKQVRIWHPQHPQHGEWLAAQAKKKAAEAAQILARAQERVRQVVSPDAAPRG